MICVLTIRNKSTEPVMYCGRPINKLVIEFPLEPHASAGDAIRSVLTQCSVNDPYLHRAFVNAIDESYFAKSYNDAEFGLQIDWKEIQ